MNDHSSPTVVVKREDSFSYETHMAFDGGIAPSLTAYQPLTGFATQECNPIAFNYPVHQNTVTSLANMLAGSAPFETVAPSATSTLPDEETSAYNLSTEIAELSISSPASSPVYHAASLTSSSPVLPILQRQQSPVCDPKVSDSPIIMEQPTIQSGPPSQAEGSRHGGSSPYHGLNVDSDYSPSGESEIEDENDHSYGESQNRRKTRSTRVSQTAHPYNRPAPKTKGNKRRGTKLEIPVPVPGLTKNRRGRCVPKKTEVVLDDGSRPFWCHVKDCDKLFNRGEHLKRHILSIHTDDRREILQSDSWYPLTDGIFVYPAFQCECKNVFSRRDNLFQHMRAKGCVVWYKNGVRQCEPDEETQRRMAAEAEDLLIEQIMADAKIAQNKRDRFCKQARAHL